MKTCMNNIQLIRLLIKTIDNMKVTTLIKIAVLIAIVVIAVIALDIKEFSLFSITRGN